MLLEDAIKKAIDGKAIVFTGAGFSSKSLNIDNKEIPLANQLSENLQTELGTLNCDDLGTLTDIYIDSTELGMDKLIKKLQNLYTFKKFSSITPAQPIIASLQWSNIYTTNYDNVFERASEQGFFKKRSPICLSDNPQDCSQFNGVVHLNGYIDRLTPQTLKSEFKLSSTSYLVDDFKESAWYDIFKSDIEAAHAIIFIGVSFKYDIDLQRVIFNTEKYKEKIIFIDKILDESESHDITINYYKQKFGTVYNIGLEAFAEKINEIKSSYQPKSLPFEFLCFNKLENLNLDSFKKPTSRDLWALLKFGYIDPNLLFYNRDNNMYVFERKELEIILSDIKNSKCRCACIVSDLANGKTCLTKLLSYKLLSLGSVFIYQQENNNIAEEIKQIAQIEGNKYIIIENYNYSFDLLRRLKNVLCTSENIYLILTARSFIHDTTRYRINEFTGLSDENIFDYNLNILSPEDENQIISLLDKSNIWDEFRNLNRNRKKELIEKKYHSQFNEVLIALIKSPNVSKEINSMLAEIRKYPISRNLIYSACISEILGLNLDINDIQELLNINSFPFSIKNDYNLNQFINITENKIIAKSTVLAKFILQQQNAWSDVVNLLIAINKHANKCVNPNKEKAIRTALVSFSNISLLLPHKNQLAQQKILEYYNLLKDLNNYKNNPFFWLQYAIACMDTKEYERAYKNLNIAYDIINARIQKDEDFDSFQVDTQYGRYLIESNCYTQNCLNPFDVIEKAHNLFINVVRRNKGQQHLVFRQVWEYNKFFDIYSSKFTHDQKSKFLQYCDDFIALMQKYKSSKLNIKESDQKIVDRIHHLQVLRTQIIKSVAA